SRAAEHVDFVETDPRTCETIRENLKRTGLAGQGRVYPMPVARALGRLAGPYDLIVADPPYEYDRAQDELAAALAAGLLAPDGTLAVEHSKRHEWPAELGERQQFFSRRYGDTCLTLYR